MSGQLSYTDDLTVPARSAYYGFGEGDWERSDQEVRELIFQDLAEKSTEGLLKRTTKSVGRLLAKATPVAGGLFTLLDGICSLDTYVGQRDGYQDV